MQPCSAAPYFTAMPVAYPSPATTSSTTRTRHRTPWPSTLAGSAICCIIASRASSGHERRTRKRSPVGPSVSDPDRPAASVRPLDWALIRAPLFPVRLPAGSRRRAAAGEAEARVLAALALASPDLSAALSRIPSTAAADRRVSRRALRYRIRMTTRPTPFGLFAGVGLARWGNRSSLSLATAAWVTRTRPDVQWLEASLVLEHDPDVCAICASS